jgi:hypothetical protein
MGVILTGIVIAIAIAIGASYVMRVDDKPAWQAYSTSSTRVGDPGRNLVGADWAGDSQNDAVDTTEADESPS